MARPAFSADTEQRRTLAALARIATQRALLDAQADELIATGVGQNIPVTAIAEALAVERKTIYRHLGRPMR